jgi:hypothetical protein
MNKSVLDFIAYCGLSLNPMCWYWDEYDSALTESENKINDMVLTHQRKAIYSTWVELVQNAYKHKAGNDFACWICRYKDRFELFALNSISNIDFDKLSAEIECIREKSNEDLKEIKKERISNVHAKGTGLLQMRLLTSKLPEIVCYSAEFQMVIMKVEYYV